jgi:hypothetical protein
MVAQLTGGGDMMNVMDDITFGNYALNVARDCAKYASAEYVNGTLFVAGCSYREASAIQQAFECNGINVVVTEGDEHSFDFV